STARRQWNQRIPGPRFRHDFKQAAAPVVENESACQRCRLSWRTFCLAMKRLAIALLSIAMTAGCLFAGDTTRPVVPGTDDLSQSVVSRATPGGQTILRDASGRTLGTANTVGTRTTFRDSSGRTTGIGTFEGNRTVFRDASGRTVWTATTSSCATTTYRDAAGRTQRTASEAQRRTIFRDVSGRTTSTVQRAGLSATVRDARGRTLGTSSTTGAMR